MDNRNQRTRQRNLTEHQETATTSRLERKQTPAAAPGNNADGVQMGSVYCTLIRSRVLLIRIYAFQIVKTFTTEHPKSPHYARRGSSLPRETVVGIRYMAIFSLRQSAIYLRLTRVK